LEAILVFSWLFCEQSAFISSCGQCSEVNQPQGLVEIYGLSV